MTAGVRNGMPERRNYAYRGTGTEMSPAEIVAKLHKGDRQVPESEARVRASLPGAGSQDDDLDGVVAKRETGTEPLARFSQHLNARMRALGWTQQDLTGKSGFSTHVTGRAINGTGCDLATAGKLAVLVGSDLVTMISAYVCGTCTGSPPAGFACLECGAEGERR